MKDFVFYIIDDMLMVDRPSREYLHVIDNPHFFLKAAKKGKNSAFCLVTVNYLDPYLPELIQGILTDFDAGFFHVDDFNLVPGYLLCSRLGAKLIYPPDSLSQLITGEEEDVIARIKEMAVDPLSPQQAKGLWSTWIMRKYKGRILLGIREMLFWSIKLKMGDEQRICLSKFDLQDMFNQTFHLNKRFDELGRAILYELKIIHVESRKKLKKIDCTIIHRLGEKKSRTYCFRADRMREIEENEFHDGRAILKKPFWQRPLIYGKKWTY